jgi:hypothetical protein
VLPEASPTVAITTEPRWRLQLYLLKHVHCWIACGVLFAGPVTCQSSPCFVSAVLAAHECVYAVMLCMWQTAIRDRWQCHLQNTVCIIREEPHYAVWAVHTLHKYTNNKPCRHGSSMLCSTCYGIRFSEGQRNPAPAVMRLELPAMLHRPCVREICPSATSKGSRMRFCKWTIDSERRCLGCPETHHCQDHTVISLTRQLTASAETLAIQNQRLAGGAAAPKLTFAAGSQLPGGATCCSRCSGGCSAAVLQSLPVSARGEGDSADAVAAPCSASAAAEGAVPLLRAAWLPWPAFVLPAALQHPCPVQLQAEGGLEFRSNAFSLIPEATSRSATVCCSKAECSSRLSGVLTATSSGRPGSGAVALHAHRVGCLLPRSGHRSSASGAAEFALRHLQQQ